MYRLLSKWLEAKPIKDKSTSIIAQFLYDIICRHECMKIQINMQGRQFVNEITKFYTTWSGLSKA